MIRAINARLKLAKSLSPEGFKNIAEGILPFASSLIVRSIDRASKEICSLAFVP